MIANVRQSDMRVDFAVGNSKLLSASKCYQIRIITIARGNAFFELWKHKQWIGDKGTRLMGWRPCTSAPESIKKTASEAITETWGNEITGFHFRRPTKRAIDSEPKHCIAWVRVGADNKAPVYGWRAEPASVKVAKR